MNTPRETRIRVLCVDDHPLLREGISSVLEELDDIELVGSADNGKQAVEAYARLKPDVTLMDLRMPDMDGLTAMGAIRQQSPDAKVIVLTTYPGDVQALNALKAGAMGYLLKSSLGNALLDTIRAVHAGKRVIPEDVAGEIGRHAAEHALSAREVDVLRRVAAGQANKRIARDLAISESTVKAHIRSILPKLGANDRTHAVTIALKRGVFDL
jgi:DNA-binding NarL/FixJ family response regulator